MSEKNLPTRHLMKGNEAIAEAAIRSGCKCFFGYPITPQTEISAYMAKRMPKVGGVYLQAESEVAAINMVYGCSGSGVRCMTSSSSPGIALKAEGISYIAGADLPCVIINVQRGGPGLGGIQPSQSDYWFMTRALGHGDFHALVFAPASVQEMVDTVCQAFDLADKYRVPTVILADGLLGQMMEPVTFPEDFDLNKNTEKPWAANGHENKRKHNIINSLHLEPDVLEKENIKRFERYEIIKANETQAVTELTDDAEILVVAYGSVARIAKSAVDSARKEGIKAGLFRPVTLWPYPEKELLQAAKNVKKVLVVEMSMGQMVEDVRIALKSSLPIEFYGRTGGVVPTPAEVLEKLKEMDGDSNA